MGQVVQYTYLPFPRPLQRMVVGMLLAGLAFVVAGFVQLKLQSAQETLKPGESKLMVYNSAPFAVDYRLEGVNGFDMNQTLNYSEVSHGNTHTLCVGIQKWWS